ncbi:MAG: hypothetical protein NT011_13600 [Kiritimatiellaeota bacterium]|nr:hypothetical protein [Kiritimatiellota bacterium]
MPEALLVQTECVPEFMKWPAAVRDDVTRTVEILQRIDTAEHKTRAFAVEADLMAGIKGYERPSLVRKYYKWVHANRDLRVLVNRAKLPRLTGKNPIGNVYKKYAENNQRGSREAWREMMRDFCAGKDFPGIGTWIMVWAKENPGKRIPDQCPYSLSNPPKGMTYSNMQHRHRLSKFEATATRIGLGAAREFLLPVLTTRVGLQPGQYYQFDDMWHDAEVNFEGQPKGMRPLEFACYDVFSASKIAYGIRPQLFDPETGKRDRLKEKEMRFMLAHVLCDVGFHKDGCTLIVEHGTAAIKPELEKRIKRHVKEDMIKISRSAILGEQVHEGMFPGRGGGNFKIKPLIEASHALSHTIAAALPGQVGMDRDHYPEQMAGLSKYNEALIKAAAKLPVERARMLISFLLHFDIYTSIMSELYARMDDRDWHALEGWEKAGLMISEFCLGEGGNWFPMENLLAMKPDQRAAITAFLQTRPDLQRTRRLSPREVWNRGKPNLVRLSKYLTPEILEYDDGFTKKVQKDGLIVFEDRYLGPGKHIYFSTVQTPDGFMQQLCREREYLLHVTPYHADSLFVSDAESGAMIGIAPRYDLAQRFDQHGIETLMGRQAHDMKLLSDPIKDRHHDEAEVRAAMIRWNEEVLNGKIATRVDRQLQKDLAEMPVTSEDVAAATGRDPTTLKELRGAGETETGDVYSAAEIAEVLKT